MLIPVTSNIGIAEPRSVELSFYAANQTPYVVEMATNIAARTSWSVLTNIAVGAARPVNVPMAVTGQRRYVRVQTRSLSEIIAPPDLGKIFGRTGAGLFWTAVEYQLFYAATNFANASTDRISISAVSFRMDESEGATLDVLVPIIEIWASTFTKPAAELSRIREENWGTDRVLLFSAQNVRFRGISDTDDAESFQITISFQKPFEYNRKSGSLLLDFKTQGPYSGKIGHTDAETRNDLTVRTVKDTPLGPAIIEGGDILKFTYAPTTQIQISVLPH